MARMGIAVTFVYDGLNSKLKDERKTVTLYVTDLLSMKHLINDVARVGIVAGDPPQQEWVTPRRILGAFISPSAIPEKGTGNGATTIEDAA